MGGCEPEEGVGAGGVRLGASELMDGTCQVGRHGPGVLLHHGCADGTHRCEVKGDGGVWVRLTVRVRARVRASAKVRVTANDHMQIGIGDAAQSRGVGEAAAIAALKE
jgi:hypothetical protein